MTTLTQKDPVTPGQVKQITRVAQDAVEKAIADYSLAKDSAQRIHGNPNWATRIREATILVLAELANPQEYKDEEVKSTYGYLSGYTKPKDVAWQSNQLRVLFPGVGFHDEKAAQMAVPEGAEGLFVIPTWQSFAKLHGVSTYASCVEIVLAKLSETRKGNFYNYCSDNELTDANFRETFRETSWKKEAMAQIAELQKGYDLLVIPAQFGLVHRGRSVRRARAVIGGVGFVLGAFEIGIMLLLHPERLTNNDDLWIDCGGDEYMTSGESEFSHAPYFVFSDGEVKFDTRWVDVAGSFYGSASASFPQ
ncbi:MAG: hypothetical protein B7X04_04395 [Parcubacteria group bacterium 21-54-25]|nr:MAG: hypothetical protein B7X04_04395 [Parcubacteria group bacterium 21-54-25]HQU08307.1 hypothetical protein [Candidatus Paceibacterota bacterium]